MSNYTPRAEIMGIVILEPLVLGSCGTGCGLKLVVQLMEIENQKAAEIYQTDTTCKHVYIIQYSLLHSLIHSPTTCRIISVGCTNWPSLTSEICLKCRVANLPRESGTHICIFVISVATIIRLRLAFTRLISERRKHLPII